MEHRLKLMILGGYGVFGGRLAELLSDTNTDILIAGRNLYKAKDFCTTLSGKAHFIPVAVDRNAITLALKEHKPTILIDATGPFQEYGDNPYSVILACLDKRVNYLDFADAADFVYGVSQFDDAAQKAGIFILSGVSSFPVLSAAVVHEMQTTMVVEHVTGGIAPSPYAGIGLNVMRAVVGYAGGPVKLLRNGNSHIAKGLTESLYYTISPPGKLPLQNLRFSLVDVPDLQVLPQEYPSIQNIWMGAGPVPESLHRILNILAILRGHFNLPAFTPFSKFFYWVLNQMKFGEHRGGMFIEAKGHINGTPTTQSWHLLAEGDDGPYIPSMAIEVIIRKYLNDIHPATGSRPAVKALDMSDYDTVFANRTIETGWRKVTAANQPLYRKVLDQAFHDLPEQVRNIHDSHSSRSWSGSAAVKNGKSIIAQMIARMIGFPKENADLPVTVQFTPDTNGELWERDFGGKKFRSYQSLGLGRNSALVTERFGIITVALALILKNDRLYLQPRRWSCLGIPLPKFLLPKGDSYETQENGQFQFNVTIEAPLIGLIAAYKGTLKSDT